MKKLFLLSLFIFLSLFIAGCDKPVLLVSSKPITKEQFVPEDMFKINTQINFVFVNHKDLKENTLRMQLLKMSHLTPCWGYTLLYGRDYDVKEKRYITGSFYIPSGGRYRLMIFQRNKDVDKEKIPLAQIDFGVLD